MNKHRFAATHYGLSSDLSIRRAADNQMIYVTGVGPQSGQWVQQTTQRAAHQLWFSLTHVLFPEKATQVTSMAATAVMSVPQPGITTFFEAQYDSATHLYQVIGWIGESMWTFHANDEKARHLWAALDMMLYPAGWEGTTTTHRPPTRTET